MKKSATSVTPGKRIAWGFGELAEGIGLSESFLRKEGYKGNLRISRFGKRVLVLDDDLQRYLAARK